MRIRTLADTGPRVPGGRYFCGYWQHEYMVDAIYTTVHRSEDGSRWIDGATWFHVTWIPSEDAIHPRASDQWRGEGYRKGSHCTAWDARNDVVVRQP